MSHFVVSFMKDVLGDNGRQVEICQRTVEIDAPSEGVATELAKQKFCKAERLCEWSLHADRIQIKATELSICAASVSPLPGPIGAPLEIGAFTSARLFGCF